MTDVRTPWLTASVIGVLLAALTGAVAAWFQTGGFDMLRFVAFSITTAPVWVGLAAALLSTKDGPEHPEDSVEMQWLTRATSAAFLDLLLVLGLTTTVTAVLGTPAVPTVVFCVIAMVDAAARYLILERKEG